MQHDDAWYIARMFAEAPKMANSWLPTDVWRTGNGARPYAFASASWLDVAIMANGKTGGVSVTLYIQVTAEPRTFQKRVLRTSLERAERFGLELEREIGD